MDHLWEPIDEFRSPGEFARFQAWLATQVSDETAEGVPVLEPYVGASTFEEDWIKHLASGEVWRLVYPDGPFRGVFERVSPLTGSVA